MTSQIDLFLISTETYTVMLGCTLIATYSEEIKVKVLFGIENSIYMQLLPVMV